MYEKELNKDKIKAMGNAIDNIMRFNSMFNAGVAALDELPEGSIDFTFGGNKAEVIKNWKRILFGDDNTKPLYLRLGELQKNLKDSKRKWDYFDLVDEKDGSLHNDLLDILIPQAPNSKFSIGRITLVTSLMDKDSQSRRKLMASFAQLLNSKSEDVADIAKDLIFYAYYSSYDQNVVNSFFDLVPPQYRKQYDKALSNTLALLNSSDELDKEKGCNIIYDNEGLNKIIDVICRNYWYDDNIVPRHYPQEFENSNKFINSKPVYGPPKTYGTTFGFPQYVVMKDNDNTVKKSPYFKIKIGKDTLLYRRIGIVQRTSVKNGKLATPMYIYAPIPKAGLHQNGTHQFEFYADYTTPSVFEDNRISTNFSHDLIRREVEKAIEKPNSKKDKILDLDIVWSDATIPAAYDKMNRQTYTTLNTAPYEEIVNKVLLVPSEEISDGHFKDPEEFGMRAANVIVEINWSGVTEIVSKEQDKKKGINEKYLEKVVTLNANKSVSKSLYLKVKDLLVDETKITKRIYLKIGDKTNIEVTEADIAEYLGIIGADSPTAKRLLSHNNVITAAVKQYKVNKCFLDLINKLKTDGVEDIYTDCAFYSNTSSAETVQFAKLMTGNTTNAHVHISNYAQFKDPKQFKKLKAALDHRKEDYNLADTTPATNLLEQIVKDTDKAELKVLKVMDDILEESNQSDDDLESEAVMDINLSPIDDSEKVEDQPAIFKQIDENKKDTAQDQQCSIQSALEDSLLD